MARAIQPPDLGFFSTLAATGSLSAAARELEVTTPWVRAASPPGRAGC
jgi:DNA-binding transcriptional LysR family regulator